MKMTKKTSIGGAYVKTKAYEYEGHEFEADIKDGDVVTILDAGSIVMGEYGEQRVFKLNTRNGEKNFALNQTSVNNLVDAFGEESEEYIGKEVKVWLIKAMVSGKLQLVKYLSALSAVMDEEGRFILEGTGDVDSGEAIDFP